VCVTYCLFSLPGLLMSFIVPVKTDSRLRVYQFQAVHCILWQWSFQDSSRLYFPYDICFYICLLTGTWPYIIIKFEKARGLRHMLPCIYTYIYIEYLYAGICAVHAKCTYKGCKDWGRCIDHSIQMSTHAVVKSRFLRVRILPTEKWETVSL